MKKDSKAYELAILGILAALCIASRLSLQFMPNIKPVTSIIVIMSILWGWKFGIKLAVITTFVSNVLLGMGIWTIFQIAAWAAIAVIAGVLGKTPLGRNQWFMVLFVFFCGYFYGFVVSLEKMFIIGPYGYVAYWLSGLTFDTLHAVGNIVFYPICYQIVKRTIPMR